MRFRSVHAVAFILLSAYCLIGCDFAVFDDLVSCPQGVSFHFYRQTPCEQFPNYPSDIRQVRVFAFDANGVLVGEFSDKKVLLSADYSLSATLQHTGKLTFVAWGGSDLESYDFSDFQEGVTTKGEMRVALRLKDRRTTSVPGSLSRLCIAGEPRGYGECVRAGDFQYAGIDIPDTLHNQLYRFFFPHGRGICYQDRR